MRIVLEADDAVATRVLEIQRAAYAVEADLVGYDAIPPLHETVTELQSQPLIFLGVSCESTLAGVLGYRRDGDTVDIDRVAVDPLFFRRGLATRLLRELLARERDRDTVHRVDGLGNQPAVSLYERFGFRVVGGTNRHQARRWCACSVDRRDRGARTERRARTTPSRSTTTCHNGMSMSGREVLAQGATDDLASECSFRRACRGRPGPASAADRAAVDAADRQRR